MLWAGYEIIEVHLEILLGNISLSNIAKDDDLYIRQYFQVDFVHVNKSAEIHKPKHHRSGNPGYNTGKPLSFAMNEFNYNANEKSITETVKKSH